MAIYLVMTLGTFACILAMRRAEAARSRTSTTSPGLARTNPAMAFVLAMLLFSLAGIPPLAGFFAKFYVFLAAVEAGLYALAVIGVLASVVGAYYYLRIVKIMYFDEPAAAFVPMRGGAQGGAGRRRASSSRSSSSVPRRWSTAAAAAAQVAVLTPMASSSMDAASSRSACRRSCLDRVGSTNAEALARAPAGESGPLWITAERADRRAAAGAGAAWASGPAISTPALLLIDPAPPAARRATRASSPALAHASTRS